MGYPIKILHKSHTLTSPTKTLPLFRRKYKEISDYETIHNYLISKDKDIDSHLPLKLRSDMYIYDKYIKTSLDTYFQYAWWVDEKNYEESIRSFVAKGLTIPFNFYYPGQFKKNAIELIEVIYGDADEREIYHDIYRKADDSFENLSIKLGNKSFLYGDKPCSVDATVFSYLAPLLKVPLKNPVISNHLRKYDNLVKYVQRIQKTYYNDFEEAYLATCETKPMTKTSKDNNKNDHVQNTVFAILFASLAMLGYAHANGFILKNLTDGNADYSDMFEAEDDDN